MSYLDELNPAQRNAVEQTTGPLLIVAGAGAGKTKTLTYRIFHLIKNGVNPRNILAVTFTNKAAREMSERVEKLMGSSGITAAPWSIHEKPVMGTFHALGVRMLREKGSAIGVNRHFSIKDQADSISLIREGLKLENADPKQYEPRKILNIISKQKNNMMTSEKYFSEASSDHFFTVVANVWRHYEVFLKKESALDFDDLITKPVVLLQEHPEVKKYYQDLWHYIHIDEYQDTNDAQDIISRMLAGDRRNICIVGDTDQNIYSWRGANIKNMLRFEKYYPEAKIVLLEENYRSSANILRAANEVISKNIVRHEKKLFTQKGEGEKITLVQAPNEAAEARYVAETSRKLIEEGVAAEDIAVLYRANFQSRVLEEAFLNRNVPYQVLGTRFFERREIKDVLSYIRAAINVDSLSDIKRIINVPARGLGKVTLVKLFAGQKDSLTPAMRQRIDDFYGLLAKIKERADRDTPSQVVKYVLGASGIETMLKSEGEEGKERLENIRELVTLATKYDVFTPQEGLLEFLSDSALASDQDELMKNGQGVRLMTVHASKGLEFRYVFITGLEQGLFPHENMDSGADHTEEERRLFYVAMTRAKYKLFLAFAEMRTIFGSTRISVPSDFLNDIPDALFDLEKVEVETFRTIWLD